MELVSSNRADDVYSKRKEKQITLKKCKYMHTYRYRTTRERERTTNERKEKKRSILVTYSL